MYYFDKCPTAKENIPTKNPTLNDLLFLNYSTKLKIRN